MTNIYSKLIAVFFLCCVFELQAGPVDTFEFDSKLTQQRYSALVKELRCPKCLNQNLADSNSPIAQDLRHKVYQLLNQQKSDAEIIEFMLTRYGDFVLYRPRVSQVTYILWFAPVVLIVLALVGVFFWLRRKPKSAGETELSAQQQQQLERILSQHSDGGS